MNASLATRPMLLVVSAAEKELIYTTFNVLHKIHVQIQLFHQMQQGDAKLAIQLAKNVKMQL
jgi:hypothetical protein